MGISFLGKDGRISRNELTLTEILGLSKNELLRGTYKNRHYIRAGRHSHAARDLPAGVRSPNKRPFIMSKPGS